MKFMVIGIILVAVLMIVVWAGVRRCNKDMEQLKSENRDLLRRLKKEQQSQLMEFERRQKAESSVLQLWQLLGNTAAELRHTIHALSGFIEVMSSDLEETDMEEQQELCRRMEGSVEQLTGMVGELAALSYYAAQKELPLNDNVPVTNFCRDLLAESGVDARYIGDIPEHYTVKTNKSGLRKVLSLLLEEAQDFSGNYAAEGERDNQIVLAVTEKGEADRLVFGLTAPGIPLAPKQRQAFFELPKDAGERVSIALLRRSTCRFLMNLLGGAIYVDPHYEKGLRFIFHIRKW